MKTAREYFHVADMAPIDAASVPYVAVSGPLSPRPDLSLADVVREIDERICYCRTCDEARLLATDNSWWQETA